MNVRWTFVHVSKIPYQSCLPAPRHLEGTRPTNRRNNKLHVRVSTPRIVDQVPHAVDQPVVVAVEPAQVVEAQVDEHQVRRVARDHVLDQILVGGGRAAADGEVRPVMFGQYMLGSLLPSQTPAISMIFTTSHKRGEEKGGKGEK